MKRHPISLTVSGKELVAREGEGTPLRFPLSDLPSNVKDFLALRGLWYIAARARTRGGLPCILKNFQRLQEGYIGPGRPRDSRAPTAFEFAKTFVENRGGTVYATLPSDKRRFLVELMAHPKWGEAFRKEATSAGVKLPEGAPVWTTK